MLYYVVLSIIYIKTKHFGATWHYFNHLIATWYLLKPLIFFLSGNLFTRGFSNTHYSKTLIIIFFNSLAISYFFNCLKHKNSNPGIFIIFNLLSDLEVLFTINPYEFWGFFSRFVLLPHALFFFHLFKP
ncbi:hypothetical protein Hdeb2414_s0621g00925611 [Helianthus debilis subsp. tardiflorus]